MEGLLGGVVVWRGCVVWWGDEEKMGGGGEQTILPLQLFPSFFPRSFLFPLLSFFSLLFSSATNHQYRPLLQLTTGRKSLWAKTTWGPHLHTYHPCHFHTPPITSFPRLQRGECVCYGAAPGVAVFLASGEMTS